MPLRFNKYAKFFPVVVNLAKYSYQILNIPVVDFLSIYDLHTSGGFLPIQGQVVVTREISIDESKPQGPTVDESLSFNIPV